MVSFEINPETLQEVQTATENLSRNEIPPAAAAQNLESFEACVTKSIFSILTSTLEAFPNDAETTKTEALEEIQSLEQRAANEMLEIFDTQTLENWGNMSMEEREAKLSELYTQIGAEMGIDAKGIIVEDCWATVGEGVCGYNAGDGYIHLDYRSIQVPEALGDVLDTVCHEARHQYQTEAIENPDRFPEVSAATVREWERNKINYSNPQQFDIEIYANQLVEADARIFAGDIMDNYLDMLNQAS